MYRDADTEARTYPSAPRKLRRARMRRGRDGSLRDLALGALTWLFSYSCHFFVQAWIYTHIYTYMDIHTVYTYTDTHI